MVDRCPKLANLNDHKLGERCMMQVEGISTGMTFSHPQDRFALQELLYECAARFHKDYPNTEEQDHG